MMACDIFVSNLVLQNFSLLLTLQYLLLPGSVVKGLTFVTQPRDYGLVSVAHILPQIRTFLMYVILL